LGTLDDFLKMDKRIQYFVAIMDGRIREKIMNVCKAAGFTGAVIIGTETVFEENVVIEEGSYIGNRTNLQYGCRIGTGVILEHGITVCAEASIGAYTSMRIFSMVGMCAQVGKHNFFDYRCTIDIGVSTAEGCSFGIGTVVLENVDTAGVYAGAPAKPMVAM
jgi:acetyltransferase-like isoleucine patch superfamily enzyme